MPKQIKTRLSRGLFVDRDVERLRQQLVRFQPYLSRRSTPDSLIDFDQATEQLLSDLFGSTSEILEAYQYAKLGEAAGLINMPEEAQESGAQDVDRESLQQRKRVLESAVSELEAHQSGKGKRQDPAKRRSVPRVADYMSPDVRSIAVSATLKQAGRMLQKFKVGSLLVDDNRRYIGIITDTDLSRKAVARALDPSTTLVKTCMSHPIISIEDSEPITEAVKLMKESGVRHLAITEDRTIIGILSVSDVLRYYMNAAKDE
ncbi:MAG TPA: CBS domain-containing protein [Nitrospiraceae bacterium]|nr:CBS domain-containing protein [Nitrospiraceae bacterium]